MPSMRQVTASRRLLGRNTSICSNGFVIRWKATTSGLQIRWSKMAKDYQRIANPLEHLNEKFNIYAESKNSQKEYIY
jgi:hypothetical protein